MLLDTSGLLCYFDRSDTRHSDARTYFNASQQKVTHTYILAEFIALAQVRGMPRQQSLSFVADLLQLPDVETVWVSQELYLNAIALLQVRIDKTYSLCDAISFLLMRERDLTESLTTDRHFEQEGFRKLL